MLPSPGCCDKADEVVDRDFDTAGTPRVSFWVSPEDEETRRWQLWVSHSVVAISFCPFCGTKCPEMVKDPDRHQEYPPTCKVTDGGYYCDSCGERLINCMCRLPGEEWCRK